MKGVVVAIPRDLDLAEYIGKKGTTNGITFFNRKSNGIAITALMPTDISEKYYALAQAIMLANAVVLSSKSVDVLFGESLIASALLGKQVILVDEAGEEERAKTEKMLEDSGANYKRIKKEDLLQTIASLEVKENGDKRIDIDRAFPVNGVGDVALGIVTSGKVLKHDTLLHSSGREVLIRSIQIQDEDVNEAEQGTRVGLALKGITYKEIEKGDILASNRIAPTKEFLAKIDFSKFAKKQEAMRCTLVHNFSASIANLAKQGEDYAVKLEKQIPISNNGKFLLVGDEPPRIFAAGTVE
ncbi:MAG: EF-Tu/IF-2/RF-3 family GTPase [Candidatus Micrarchaeia archaeon]